MSRVLVTGASGFIGRAALPALLERGYEVIAVSSRTVPGEGPGPVRWVQGDLLDPAVPQRLLERTAPSHLLHLAWYAEPGAFWSAPENVRWVEASLRLARAFIEQGGQRLVAAGTCAEYDWSAGGRLSEGSTPLRPGTLYGACKHALHTVLSALPELSLAWGRVFWLYGPGEDPSRLVASLAGRLLAGERAPCSTGEQVRDFLHVADVGAAFGALLDSPVRGAVNVASGVPVRVAEIIEQVGRATGRPELLGWGEVPMRENEPPELVGASERLCEEVGFAARYALDRGIEETVRSLAAAVR